MTLARDEYIFLIILAVNLIVSVIYLLTGTQLIMPVHKLLAKEDDALPEKEDALPEDENDTEFLYDNRSTYVLHFIEMILCPVIVPLFFLMGHLFYLFVFWRNANLESVIFSKERVKTNQRADEDVERNIIPLEEALLVNEKKDLRSVFVNVMHEDITNSLVTLKLALDSEDTETAHYAAAVLSDELNKFRIFVQKHLMEIRMKEDSDSDTECEETLLDYMDNILKQHILSEEEQGRFVQEMAEAAELLYEKDLSRLSPERYEAVCLRTLEIRDYGNTEKWCLRMEKQYPDELSAYTCKLKLYFARQDRDDFFKTLDALKQSDVVIDQETLELIRIFSTRRQS